MNPHINELTRAVIGAAIEVHRHLGPGLLESSYRECLCQELRLRGVDFRRECKLPLGYKGIRLECGYRIDILVGEVVTEGGRSLDADSRGSVAYVSSSWRMESWIAH